MPNAETVFAEMMARPRDSLTDAEFVKIKAEKERKTKRSSWFSFLGLGGGGGTSGVNNSTTMYLSGISIGISLSVILLVAR